MTDKLEHRVENVLEAKERRAASCPFIRGSSEGTQWCALAEQHAGRGEAVGVIDHAIMSGVVLTEKASLLPHGAKLYTTPQPAVPDVHTLACALAEIDGFEPADRDGGLYDLIWSGGSQPEPEGDLYSIKYLPKAEQLAALLSAAKGEK